MTYDCGSRSVRVLVLMVFGGIAGVLLLYAGIPLVNDGMNEYVSSFARGAPHTNVMDPSIFERYWSWAFLAGAAWVLCECMTASQRPARQRPTSH